MTTAPEYVGFIAMSLDGFIATPDGSVAWLDPFNKTMGADGGDGGYGEFIAGIDALLVGRETYDQVIGWGWPYENRPAYVLTRNAKFDGPHIAAAGDINSLRYAIKAANHRRIWVMGGGAAQRAAIDAGMFDALKVFVMPTLLGSGRPLFTNGKQHNLTYVSSHAHNGGVLEINYQIGK